MRIEVGYGLEGSIPDAFAKRVTSDIMKPAFKRGAFAAGLEEALTALGAAARGEAPALPAQSNPDFDGDNLGFFLIIFFLIGFFMLRAVLKGSGNRSSGSRSSSSSSSSYSFSSSTSSSSWDCDFCGGGGDFGGGGASDDW